MRCLAATLTLLVLVATGCGGETTYSQADGGIVSVHLDEYRIKPMNVQVKAGRVRLRAVNDGRLTHNLVVEQLDREPGEEARIYGRTRTLHPGERGTEQEPITLAPGKYRLTCSIANHDDLGQWGELKVVP